MSILDSVLHWLGWDDDEDDEIPLIEAYDAGDLDPAALDTLQDIADYLGVSLEEVLDLDPADAEELAGWWQEQVAFDPPTPQYDPAEEWQMDVADPDPIATASGNPNLELAAVFAAPEEAAEYISGGNPGVLIPIVDPRDGSIAVFRVTETHP